MLYLYGMRLRGFSPGAQPKRGFDHRREDATGKYYDILAYTSPLTVKEVCDYELDYLGEREEPSPYHVKVYDLHMVLQDVHGKNSFGKAYGISVDPTISFEEALNTIKMHINSEDHICCSAYIVERDGDVKNIVYAQNYVSIIGGYYPNVIAQFKADCS